MKKILPIILLFVLMTFQGYAQNQTNKWALGFHGGKNEYYGDIGNALLDFNKAWYGFGGITINRFLTPSFDLRLEGTRGHYGHRSDWQQNFRGFKNDVTLLFAYKLNNGYILGQDSWFAPSIVAGPGMAFYGVVDDEDHRIDDEGIDLLFGVGASLRLQFSRRLALQLQTTANFPNSSVRDLVDGDDNDRFLKHSAGLVFTLGRPPVEEVPVEVVDPNAERLRREAEEARRQAEEAERLRLEEERRAEEARRQAEEAERLRLEEERRQERLAREEVIEALNPEVVFVLFDIDHDNIKPEFHNILETVVLVLKDHPDMQLEIVGHTDITGSAEHNQGLSVRRAESVKQFLVNRGVDASRLVIRAYGENRPRATNETDEGRTLNRRVAFRVIE